MSKKDKINNPKYLNFLVEYSRNSTKLRRGEKAPDFYLPNLNNIYKSLADYKGRVILLNFWYPGCLPCRKEIPFERKLLNDFRNKDFVLINICMETKKENWLNSISKLNIEGGNLFASKNWQKILVKKYKISGWPHYTLIDKQGNKIS